MPSAPTSHPMRPAREHAHAEPRTRWHPVRGGVAIAVLATTVCVVALLVGGGSPRNVPLGLPDPGAATGWAVRLVRLCTHLAAVLTIGSLLVGAVLVRDEGARSGVLAPTARRAVRAGGSWAAAWAALTAAAVLLTAAGLSGVPVLDLDLGRIRASGETAPVRGLAIAGVGAVAVAVAARSTRSVRGCRLLLLLALATLLPPTLAGHSSTAVASDVALSGLAVHVVAAALWTGGLAGLLLHARTSTTLAGAVGRFSDVALVAYAAVGVSGLLTAWTRLPSWTAWSSGYGAVVAAKVVALLVLGGLGHWQRRRALPALASGRPHTFARLAAVEVAVMGAAMGLAAALANTPVPSSASAVAANHGSGHPSLPATVEPFALVELATAWRPQAPVLVVLGLALATYVRCLRRLAARGRTWPAGRTVAFSVGLALALVDLCSGVATYASAMVSVQVVQLLVMLLAVPALLTLGAPLTLWAEAGGSPMPWVRGARAVLNPLTGAALSCATVLLVYRTPLVELSLRSFWIHDMVLGLALASGLALMWPAIGIDPVPDPRPLSQRVAGVLVVTASLALLAIQLTYGQRLLAGEWFLELRWGWVDPVADQRRAGAIVATAAAATLLTATGALVRARVATPSGSPGR